MDPDQRVRRLFGPPPEGEPQPTQPAAARRPAPVRLVAAAAVAVLLSALLAAYVLTPKNHVAEGCFWWTAGTVDRVVAGSHGCVRGYVVGGALAEAAQPASFRISFTAPAPGSCPFSAGDAVVVRYHAIFDDGRTLIVTEGCR